MSLPQLNSSDYYFRIEERKLPGLRLGHSMSVEDPSVWSDIRHFGLAGRRAGVTEWEGCTDGYPLSLGWDWMEADDGAIHPVMVVGPRTNIMLIDRKGYDVPEATAAAFLWQFIAGLPWQGFVAESLLRDGPACSLPPRLL